MSLALVTLMLKGPLVEAGGVSESATETTKFDVPRVVGVPEIAPVAVIESPTGRLPDTRDHT
jgi:hypothetical protein